MKKSMEIIQAKKRVWGYALAFIAGMLFVACTADRDFSQQPDPQDGDKVEVLLTVRTPEASLPTRAQAHSETTISAVRLLILEYIDSEYKFSYQVSGIEITSAEGQQTRFKALLKASDSPLKLLVLANTEAAFGSYAPLAGTPEATVRKELSLSFSSAGLTGDLPMYGEILLPDGLTDGSSTLSATMLRAIARVDVVKDLEDESPDFILEEVYVFRNYNKIQLIPTALVPSSSVPKVNAPSIPDDAVFLSNPVSKIVPAGADAIVQTYIPESAAATTDAGKLNGTATLVVGGRFGGSGNEITYYRADFDSELPGHPFGQVLRNHRYVFNIKKVTATGWNTPEDAANNLATSIVVDVQAWEDFSADLYFGTNRFAISSRSISMRFVGNREKRLDVESTLQYRIQWLDASGNPTGSATSAVNTTISNGDFDATIVKDPGDPEKVSHLLFRTRNSNYAGNVITDKLRITVDNWSIDISVRQDNTAMYSTRHFSVLSGHDFMFPVGNLGTTTNPTALLYSGLSMRQIIDKQFAPNGVIKIGGFTFDLANDSDAFFGATTATNLDVMRRLIRTQNVIYLSSETFVSIQVADILLDWLSGSPERILIVGTDNAKTNSNLLSKLTKDATWLFNIAAVSTNYIRAAASTETDDFFAGPFGQVTVNSSFNRADDLAGYSISHSYDVIPLIVGDRNANAMVFGINKKRRIVYHGDANLFQINQLSNNSGNVATDPDKFMANVWAWIVEQLIYGND